MLIRRFLVIILAFWQAVDCLAQNSPDGFLSYRRSVPFFTTFEFTTLTPDNSEIFPSYSFLTNNLKRKFKKTKYFIYISDDTIGYYRVRYNKGKLVNMVIQYLPLYHQYPCYIALNSPTNSKNEMTRDSSVFAFHRQTYVSEDLYKNGILLYTNKYFFLENRLDSVITTFSNKNNRNYHIIYDSMRRITSIIARDQDTIWEVKKRSYSTNALYGTIIDTTFLYNALYKKFISIHHILHGSDFANVEVYNSEGGINEIYSYAIDSNLLSDYLCPESSRTLGNPILQRGYFVEKSRRILKKSQSIYAQYEINCFDVSTPHSEEIIKIN